MERNSIAGRINADMVPRVQASDPIQDLPYLLTQLVDLESVSGNEEAITDYIRQQLPSELRVTYDYDTVLVVEGPRHPERPLVVLAGHTDTVPVANNLPSRIAEGELWGRGASDMKAGLAVMLAFARTWVTHAENSDFDLGLCFFGREELAAQHNPLPAAIKECATLNQSDLAILMEPTLNQLELGCLGNLNFNLSFEGEAAHSARPWLGVNAVHKAIRNLQQLVEVQPKAVMVQGLPYIEAVSITGFLGGTARNILPARARIEVNVRYAPSRLGHEVEHHWRQQFSEVATFDLIGNAAAAPPLPDNPLVARLGSAIGSPATSKQAWTNVADFATVGKAAVNFGPGDPGLAHRDDERVQLDALTNSSAILAKFFGLPLPTTKGRSVAPLPMRRNPQIHDQP